MDISFDRFRLRIPTKLRVCLIFLFISMSILQGTHVNVANARTSYSSTLNDLSALIHEINFTSVQSHVEFFSSLGSRVTGYPGSYIAADYIAEEFERYNLNVTRQPYETAVPIDEGSYVLANGLNITAYALWPNGGVTASILDGLTGRLYYAGDGDLKRLDGINLTDAVLLMDFNSGSNWIKAANLGAKAVIFIEPYATDKIEALAKASQAPLNFPRLYVNMTSGTKLVKLAKNHSPITIYSKMIWKRIEAYNIIGELVGERPEDVIILSAHYDSWSISPALSPAAEDSIGISTLLELARVISKERPLRTILFVAYSGHWEGRIGATEFCEKALFDTSKKIWLQLGIDISSESSSVDFIFFSPLYGGSTTLAFGSRSSISTSQTFVSRYLWIESVLKDFYENFPLEKIKQFMPPTVSSISHLAKYSFYVDGWFGTQPDFYLLDSEAAIISGSLGVTMRTQYGRRMLWLTPLSIDRSMIDWRNVQPQIIMAAIATIGLANVEPFPTTWSQIAPTKFQITRGVVLGYTTIYGKTVEFNFDTGWYSPIPNALVRLRIFFDPFYPFWPFTFQHKMSDENGSFAFYGVIPWVNWEFDAWKFDNNTGDVIYAVDKGHYGTAQGVSGGIKDTVYPLSESFTFMIPLFRCVPVTIFDLIDVTRMSRTTIYDLRNPWHAYYQVNPILNVWEYSTRSTPIFWGMYQTPSGVSSIFVTQGERIVITYNPNPLKLNKPLVVLTNSSDDRPEGAGYLIEKPTLIHFTIFKSTMDIYRMTKNRYYHLKIFEVRSPYAEETIKKAEGCLNVAVQSLKDMNYSRAYEAVIAASGSIGQGYASAVMPLYNEAASSVIFFAVLMLPFAVLFEKLLLGKKATKRFIGMGLILAVLLSIFYFVHPAFSILSNASMTVVAVGILLLLFMVLTIFFADMKNLLESVSVDRLGYHLFKREEVSVVMHTMIASVENMRRRPLLTVLAFITIVAFTAAQTSLTSTTYGFAVQKGVVPAAPPYNGILIKNMYGMPPEARGGVLDYILMTYVESIAGENYYVSPRVWLYPISSYPTGVHVKMYPLKNPDEEVMISPSVIIGLSNAEIAQLFSAQIVGSTNFTVPYQCILPKTIADKMDVEIGDTICLKGYGKFIVIGTSDFKAQIRDFDNRFFFPISPEYSADLSLMAVVSVLAGQEPQPISPSSIIVVPWNTALKLGGFISSISLMPKGSVTQTQLDIDQLASEIALNVAHNVFVGYEGNAYGMRRILAYTFIGWEQMSILLVMASLSILNFMLNSINLRKREVSTYASLGLSPSGAIIMYLTESVTLALGGTIIGYLVGFVLNKTFILMKFLPESFMFNFTSLPVIISLFILIMATVASAFYPAFLASKMITPSLERRWKVTYKPKGDDWEVPLPFRMERQEIMAILLYLREFFEGVGSLRAAYKVNKTEDVDMRDLHFTLEVSMLPIELNVVQDVHIMGRVRPPSRNYFISIHLKRKTGDRSFWRNKSLSLIDDIRKQILLWRSLPPQEKMRYHR